MWGRPRFTRPLRRGKRKTAVSSKRRARLRTVVHEVPVNEPLYKTSRYWYQDVTYKIDAAKITGEKSESFKDVIWVEVHSDRLVIGTRKGRKKLAQVIPLSTNDRVSVTESTKKESMWDFEHPEEKKKAVKK